MLRHRIVLSYDALSEGVTADDLLTKILAAVAEPGHSSLTRSAAGDPIAPVRAIDFGVADRA